MNIKNFIGKSGPVWFAATIIAAIGWANAAASKKEAERLADEREKMLDVSTKQTHAAIKVAVKLANRCSRLESTVQEFIDYL